jgi:1-acyl-sn-glycerol-3-phosphate acyltransferase
MMASALAAASRLVSGANAEWHCARTSVRQRVYFANHSSHLDFVVIWSALPFDQRALVRPVAGMDYWNRGPVRRYLSRHVFHAVLIERNKPGAQDPAEAARASIQRMADEMGDTYSLIVFPEGTRSVSGEVAIFKSGLYHLAVMRQDVEFVPVHLENLNRILPKGESLPVPMLSRLVFGPPMGVRAGETKEEFLRRARAAVTQLGKAS